MFQNISKAHLDRVPGQVPSLSIFRETRIAVFYCFSHKLGSEEKTKLARNFYFLKHKRQSQAIKAQANRVPVTGDRLTSDSLFA